jgi:hypothetical protein
MYSYFESTTLAYMSHLGARRGLLHIRGRVAVSQERLSRQFAQAETMRYLTYQ